MFKERFKIVIFKMSEFRLVSCHLRCVYNYWENSSGSIILLIRITFRLYGNMAKREVLDLEELASQRPFSCPFPALHIYSKEKRKDKID